jgi:hypothetical protein
MRRCGNILQLDKWRGDYFFHTSYYSFYFRGVKIDVGIFDIEVEFSYSMRPFAKVSMLTQHHTTLVFFEVYSDRSLIAWLLGTCFALCCYRSQ